MNDSQCASGTGEAPEEAEKMIAKEATMIDIVTKSDLEELETRLKREIYEEVETALTKASIIQAPVVPSEELSTPRIDLENAFQEGATTEQMDDIENKEKAECCQ